MMNTLKFFVTKAAEDCRTPRRSRDFAARSTGVFHEIREGACEPPPGLGVRQSSAAFRSCAEDALTFIDLLVVVAVLAIAVALLLPALAKTKGGPRIRCITNLKQVSLAFLVYAGDNNDRLPMETMTNKLGRPLYANSKDAFRYFQVMSNELSNPFILICPQDKRHRAATNFTTDFDSSHISFFLGLNPENYPNAFLAGDSNITNGFAAKNGLLELTTNQSIGWTKERHENAGNVALADGSVQQFSQLGLKDALEKTGLATNVLLMPR